MQLVTRMRLNRATILLLNTSEPIKSIAGRVGYESQYAFSAVFKRHIGMSPERFRKTRADSPGTQH